MGEGDRRGGLIAGEFGSPQRRGDVAECGVILDLKFEGWENGLEILELKSEIRGDRIRDLRFEITSERIDQVNDRSSERSIK
jgi:hypothetical protein